MAEDIVKGGGDVVDPEERGRRDVAATQVEEDAVETEDGGAEVGGVGVVARG